MGVPQISGPFLELFIIGIIIQWRLCGGHLVLEAPILRMVTMVLGRYLTFGGPLGLPSLDDEGRALRKDRILPRTEARKEACRRNAHLPDAALYSSFKKLRVELYSPYIRDPDLLGPY